MKIKTKIIVTKTFSGDPVLNIIVRRNDSEEARDNLCKYRNGTTPIKHIWILPVSDRDFKFKSAARIMEERYG